uniref:Zinc finger protein RFP-like n=1 Tax=Salvator merianae TaxID=96440 RepID=A0A8D0BPM0_SALMN
MATKNPLKNCCDEATCSICLDYFKDPVTVDCGHNFCQVCITQCLEKPKPSCPECRETISQRNFRPNRELTNLVELIKKLQLEMQKEEKRGVCEKHQEPLKLFCQEDQMCICLVCDKSKEHKDHDVLPLEEAFDEYKGKVNKEILSLVQKRQQLEALCSDEEQKSQKRLTLLEKERQNGLSVFEKLQKSLEENKHAWLHCLADLEERMKKNGKENANRLLSQITELSSLIAKLEEKSQQPAGEFLQDIAMLLIRCTWIEEGSPELKPFQVVESALTVFTRKRETLEKSFKDCQDILENTLQKVHVTLDEDTVHGCLSISENQRSVTGGEEDWLLSFHRERFDTVKCVLGCEKFTSGRHYWDVDIEGNQAAWVGVARKSVRRKGDINFSPEEGIWAIQSPITSHSQLLALMSPSQTTASSSYQLSKVRVSLDYEAGRVEFFDRCSGRSFFTFSSASFAGERVCPFFQVSQGTNLNCC